MNEEFDSPAWTSVRLLEIRALRDGLFVVTLILSAWLAWQLRIVTVPALLAFICTLLVEPIVTHLQKYHIPRLVSALALVLILATACATLFANFFSIPIVKISGGWKAIEAPNGAAP